MDHALLTVIFPVSPPALIKAVYRQDVRKTISPVPNCSPLSALGAWQGYYSVQHRSGVSTLHRPLICACCCWSAIAKAQEVDEGETGLVFNPSCQAYVPVSTYVQHSSQQKADGWGASGLLGPPLRDIFFWIHTIFHEIL